jgi:hypothetical protein
MLLLPISRDNRLLVEARHWRYDFRIAGLTRAATTAANREGLV